MFELKALKLKIILSGFNIILPASIDVGRVHIRMDPTNPPPPDPPGVGLPRCNSNKSVNTERLLFSLTH